MTVAACAQTLADVSREVSGDLYHADGLVAFPYYWQVPAATEKAAYEAVLKGKRDTRTFLYIGFPWATLMDALATDSQLLPSLIDGLRKVEHFLQSRQKNETRVTVAQHIRANDLFQLFETFGITGVFWSHALKTQTQFNGLRIHPFPLYPAQAPAKTEIVNEDRPRRYLANFIGAYNPSIYLTNVRQVIFADAETSADLLIVKRDVWHFDRSVYREQMRGVGVMFDEKAREAAEKQEYLDAIKESWFTFCPTGSGPNSIRIYESLASGSIPIILSKSLRLPYDKIVWKKSSIIEEDSESGYRRALAFARSMTLDDRKIMITSGIKLYENVGPHGYLTLLNPLTNLTK